MGTGGELVLTQNERVRPENIMVQRVVPRSLKSGSSEFNLQVGG